MLGAIVGDIVGSRFEFNNHRSKDFELFDPSCFPTDDSIMTLAIAQALMEAVAEFHGAALDASFDERLSELAVKRMRSIGQRYPNCGYGGRFGVWMFESDPQPYNSFGNGAAMRINPIGFFASNAEQVKRWSQAVTRVTHNHPEGIKGAEATAMAILLARQGASQDEIRELIQRDYYPLDFTIDEIRPTYPFNETCQLTVPQAIQCFLESESFEDAIRIAISLGGDSDTVAAIAGPIAEAFYKGVPTEIGEQAVSYLDENLQAILHRWQQFEVLPLVRNTDN